LSRFVKGPRYHRAHSGAEALDLLTREPVDLIYLDMRFDRIPRVDLMGDHNAVTREKNGDEECAWKYQQNNQGLFILEAVNKSGHGHIPVILAYDFSYEIRRLENLTRIYPSLRWVPDTVTPDEIKKLIDDCCRG
jgi:hypothetical protein